MTIIIGSIALFLISIGNISRHLLSKIPHYGRILSKKSARILRMVSEMANK